MNFLFYNIRQHPWANKVLKSFGGLDQHEILKNDGTYRDL